MLNFAHDPAIPFAVAASPDRSPADGAGHPWDPDSEAILALQKGDERGLETLVVAHQARALRVAFGITGDRGIAEEVVAEAFLKAYLRIGTFDAGRATATSAQRCRAGLRHVHAEGGAFLGAGWSASVCWAVRS